MASDKPDDRRSSAKHTQQRRPEPGTPDAAAAPLPGAQPRPHTDERVPGATVLEYGEWADAVQLAALIADVEAQMWIDLGPGQLPTAQVYFVILGANGNLGCANVPFTRADLERVAPGAERGKTGRFLATLAVNMMRMSPAKLRADMEADFFREGDRLLFTCVVWDTVTVYDLPQQHADSTAVISDLEQDVPDVAQVYRREMFACDGRGNAWQIARPAAPTQGPTQMWHWRCVPDLEGPGRFTHDTIDELGTVEGFIPWALAAMAIAYREVFQNKIEYRLG